MTNSRDLEKSLHALVHSRFNLDAPGVAAIVVRDGRTLLRTGAGMANLELGVAIRPEMVFRIGSITKQFTAAAILMLEARGRLSLQDRITKFIPRYPVRGHKITIEHLLTHTSGIKSYTEMPEFWKEVREDKPVPDQIAFFKDQPMAFAPGERFHYNNSGYVLLGAIIEKVSGRRYEEFVQREIFDKLGMSHSHYDMPEKVIPGRVAGYASGATGVENAPYLGMTRPYAAGSLASNVDDLALWDAALYTRRILPASALQRAWRPTILRNGGVVRYGYGWGMVDYAGVACIEHSGGIHGFLSHAIRIPEQRIFAAVLANTTSPSYRPSLLCFELAAVAMGRPYQPPVTVTLNPRQLDAVTGRYAMRNEGSAVSLMRKGRALLFHFDEQAPPMTLLAESSDVFRMPDSTMRIEVVKDAAGKATGLRLWDRDSVVDTASRIVA